MYARRPGRFLSVLVIAGAIFAAHRARAAITLSPGFPVNELTKKFALRYQYSLSAYTFPGDADHGTFGQQGTQTVFPDSSDDGLTLLDVQGTAYGQLSAYFGNRFTVASAGGSGSIGGGHIGAYAATYAQVGMGRAESVVTFDFMDLLNVDISGVPNYTLSLNGTPSFTRHTTNTFANAFATAEFWVWPTADGIPAQDKPYSFAFHASHTFTADGDSVVTDSDPSKANYPAGSKFWIAARLQVKSIAQEGDGPFLPNDNDQIDAIGDFSHTLRVGITADPSTPDFAYHTESGIDYTRTLPEPSLVAATLVLASAVALRRRRRCA